MASSLWLVRTSLVGDFQYACSDTKPTKKDGLWTGDNSVLVRFVNRFAEGMAGRELELDECVEIVCSEVME